MYYREPSSDADKGRRTATSSETRNGLCTSNCLRYPPIQCSGDLKNPQIVHRTSLTRPILSFAAFPVPLPRHRPALIRPLKHVKPSTPSKTYPPHPATHPANSSLPTTLLSTPPKAFPQSANTHASKCLQTGTLRPSTLNPPTPPTPFPSLPSSYSPPPPLSPHPTPSSSAPKLANAKAGQVQFHAPRRTS